MRSNPGPTVRGVHPGCTRTSLLFTRQTRISPDGPPFHALAHLLSRQEKMAGGKQRLPGADQPGQAAVFKRGRGMGAGSEEVRGLARGVVGSARLERGEQRSAPVAVAILAGVKAVGGGHWCALRGHPYQGRPISSVLLGRAPG